MKTLIQMYTTNGSLFIQQPVQRSWDSWKGI